jgi:hypothetical protein
MNKFLGKNDIKLIVILLLSTMIVVGALFARKLTEGQEGKQVVVSVDGVEVASFPLDEDLTYEIAGYDEGHNTLIIKDGEAYMSDASCPDHLCMGMGKISHAGQSIICLPNRVIVEIRDNGKKEAEYDTVS